MTTTTKKLDPLPSRTHFALRLLQNFGIAATIVAASLLLGSWGYHYFGDLPWVDSLLNASMILTGMGPVDTMKTNGAKLFATFYALYSGVIFLSVMAIILTPIVHRWLHKFHLDIRER
jgi:hypothetical protein